MPSDGSDLQKDAVPEVCVSCRFGTGPRRDCTLIISKSVRALVEEGPCKVGGRLSAAIKRKIATQFPLAQPHADDAAQEALLEFLSLEDRFPGDRLVRLPDLERWLERFAGNQVIDHLRRVRVIKRLRCGACVNFAMSLPPRCTLEFIGDAAEELHPNPWWGRKVDRHTDPRALAPPCRDFAWRPVATFDLFEQEAVDEKQKKEGAEETARLLVLALDRLAARSERGLTEATTLQRHYFRRETVPDIANATGVSEKTVKRLLAAGREDLLEILSAEMGVESLADLAS